MAQQQSFLPKLSAAAESSVPKLSAKSLSRLSVLFATVGAVAFIQNAGFAPRSGALLGGAADNESGGRSLTLESEEIAVTTIDDRVLQVAVNGIAEGYYKPHTSDGTCLDSSAPPIPYDYTRFYEITAEKCASRCAASLLLSEHRGFNYDDASNDCCCLFDDRHVPLSESRKAPEFNVDFNGQGPISAVDGTKANYKCYIKDTQTIGQPIDSYESALCPSDDGKERDVVMFGEIFSSAECAEKCIRFKLFATHSGFSQQTDQCACLFQRGEAPSGRKLSGSGAIAKRKQTYADRYADVADPENVECYSKINLQDADPQDRLADDPTQQVWINEFHYRNAGLNEPFIEVIGPNGADATDYEVIVYQGRNGAIHNRVALTGTFVGTGDWGFVTVDLESAGIRKGKQGGDGLGLNRISDSGCLQLLSYTDAEGVDRSFKAKQGVCSGKASTPIGTFEERLTPSGHSLQLQGSGNTLSAFTWASTPKPATRGNVNVDQTLTAPPAP